MEKKEVTCIGCPMGCQITVEIEEGEAVRVLGNGCLRGDVYARNEVKSPMRVITTTLAVENGDSATVPVKTNGTVPKDKMLECMEELKKVNLQLPVYAGEVVLENVAGTGTDVIATRTVLRKP